MSDLKDGYGGPDDELAGLLADDAVLLDALQPDVSPDDVDIDAPEFEYSEPEAFDMLAEGFDPSIESIVEDRYAPVPPETEADLMSSIIGEKEAFRQLLLDAAAVDHGESYSQEEMEENSWRSAEALQMMPLEADTFTPPLSSGIRAPSFRGWTRVKGAPEHPFVQRMAEQKSISLEIQEDFDKEWDKGNYFSAITGLYDNLKQSADSIPTLEQVVETGEFFVSRGPEKGERKGLSRKVEQSTTIGAGIGAGIGGTLGTVKGFVSGGPKGAVIGGLGGTMLGGMLGAGATYFTAASFEEDTVSPFLLRMYSLTEADKLRQWKTNFFSAMSAVTLDNVIAELSDQGIDIQPKVDELNLVATQQLKEIAEDQRSGEVRHHVLVDRLGQLMGQSLLEIMQYALEKPEFRAKLLRDRERVYRLQKPDDLTWMMVSALRKANEDFGSTPEEQEEKKAYLQAQFTKIMDMASYESLPEELRRDRIPLEDFKSLIADNFEMEDLDSNPMLASSRFLNEAARAVLLEVSDEEIRAKLDKVSFGTFSHLDLWPLLKSDDHNVFPDDAKVRNWAQEHQTATRAWGSDATVNMERTLGRMMMTPTKMGEEVYMPESTFAMLMRMTTWAPSAVAEIDFSQGTSLRLNDKGQWEASNERVRHYLTPASYDRAHNLGVRDFKAGYFARLAAAIRTGNIGYQPAISDVMRAKGWKPGHEHWQLFQYLGLAMDFLVPWERPYLLAAGKIAGATTATPRVLRNSKRMPRGHRAKMFYAQVAPGLYSRAKGLQDSDPLTAIHNVILEAQRDLHAKGDTSRPYLDQIQKENLDEMLRVAGLDPKEVHDSNEKLFEVIRQARAAGLQRGLGSVGTPGVAASRQSPGFQRFRQALSDAMDQGIIPRDQYAHIVAQFERQAAVIANDPTIPEIQTISDFFEAFELTLGRQPGPGARFMEGPAEPGYVHMAPKTEAARRLVEADAAPGAPAGRPIVENFFTEAAISTVRRADEIPNSRDRLVYLTPGEFLRLAEPLDTPFAPKAEAIQRDMGLGEKFPDVPRLKMNEEGRIVDHDGRHRAMALRDRGVDRIPVRLESSSGAGKKDIRWNLQNQPGRNAGREYVDRLPTELIGQDGTSRIKAPYYTEGPNRGQVLPEYSGAPRAPEAPAQRLPEIPAESASYEGQMQVGRVLFDSKNGLGSVPNNSNVAYLGFVVWMKPRDFIGLNPSRGAEEAAGTVAATRRAIEEGQGVGPAFLIVDLVTEGADAGSFTVRNHEGRGRMMAINEIDPDTPVPVHMFGRRSISRGADITPEMLEGLVDPSSRVRILADRRVPGGGEIKPDAAWHVPDGPGYDPNYLPSGKVYRSAPGAPEAPVGPRYMRGPGKVPMGFFEWNPQTNRFIINLYRNADMNVLWHENGHLLATIMGRRWSSKLFKFFDHAVDGQGKVKLTSRGHEELAEAWRMYRKVRDSRHGPVRRLFDQLWLEVRNLYYSLRGQPGALPRQAIRIWDLEFGPDPRIIAYSVEVAKRVTKNKRARITIDADRANRIKEEYPRKYGGERERRRPRLDPESVRQALGLKFETFVDTMPDGTRIPRRRLMKQNVDALDIYEKALALVLTEDIRSKLGPQKILRPTARTMIPEERANRLNESVRDRMIQAFGMSAKELSKQVLARKYQREVGFVWREMSELGDHITQADVDALATRMRIQTGNKFDPEAVHNIELIALKDEQAAGFHTLVHELAAEPMGNRIPDGMLDPDTSFRLVEINEFERIVDTLIDVEAGVGSRASRLIESIPDTLTTSLMNGFSRAVDSGFDRWAPSARKIQQNIKRFFEIPTFGKDYFDDGVRDIFESAMRRLGTLDQWVLSTQRRLKGADPRLAAKVGFNQNGFVALVTDLRRQLTPIVDPGQIRSLYGIHKELNDVVQSMDLDARVKLSRGETVVGLKPDMAGIPVQYIYKSIDRIQALLGDWYGMTPNERIAVNTVRQYKLRPAYRLGVAAGNPYGLFTDLELYKLADSIQTIKMGIDAKFRAVDAKGRKIWRMMGGDPDAARAARLTQGEVREIYLDFYNGNLAALWDRATNAGLKGFDVNKPSLFDANKAFLEMVVRMRAEEIIEELSRDLAEYGLNGELRSLSNFKKLGDDATFDRDFFGQRVEHHINEIINWRNRDLMEAEGAYEYRKTKGKSRKPKYTGKYHAASKVPPEKWGTVESATKQITDPYDFMAQTVATDMLYKWGFKFGKGQWEFVDMPDGTKQLMPQMVAREIETALDRAAGVGQTSWKGRAWSYNMSPKHNFGVAITGGKPTAKTRAISGLGRVIDVFFDLFPLTTRRISTGVTIGHGLMPTLPYYGGVIIGLQFQNYMARGAIKATWDAANMLPTMAGATSAIGSRAAGKALSDVTGIAGLESKFAYRPDMVGAVMSRMWRDGQWRPEAVPIITKNFRVLTADHVADLAQQYGLKSSFIEAENAESLMKKIYEAYPTDVVGKLQQPFKWYQTFKIEAATFIDNYIRLRIFIDELRNGRRPNDAARIAKKTAFDYSELSEAEKNVARHVILFYSYFRKNADLFWDTAIKNPERIISQLRLIAGSQRSAAEGEDEAIVFPAYAGTRAITPTLKLFNNTQRYKGINYMAPYLPVPDMLMIPANMYDAMFLDGEMQSKGYRDIVSRFNPLLQAPFVTATSKDIYFNRSLSRSPNQVPAYVVLADYAWTGGALWDFLDIDYVEADQISNPMYQEVQGRGIYVARKPIRYWWWKNLNQVAGGGRTSQWLWDLDKMNVGYVEAKNRLALAYLETTGGGLLQRTGWVNWSPEPGWKGKPQATAAGMPIPEGTDPGSAYYDTAWPRPGMMEPIGQRVPPRFAHLVGLPPNDAIAELRVMYADDNVMQSALDNIATEISTPREKSERLMALYGARDIVDPRAVSLRELPAAFGFRPLMQPYQTPAAIQMLRRHKRMVEQAAKEQRDRLEKTEDR